MKNPSIRIAGPLRSRVNRLVHVKAQRFGLDEQARLMAQLQKLADTGATIDELHAHLDLIESGKGELDANR